MTDRNPRKSSSRKGFNLIEAAIVLGVVGLVVGGIWVAAAAVTSSRQVNQTVNGIMAVIDNTKHIYGRLINVGDFIDNQPAWDMGIFNGADGFYLSGTYTFTPLKSRIRVWVLNGVPGYMKITFYPMPTAQCIKVFSRLTKLIDSKVDGDGYNMVVFQGSGGHTVTNTSYPYMPTADDCTGRNIVLYVPIM